MKIKRSDITDYNSRNLIQSMILQSIKEKRINTMEFGFEDVELTLAINGVDLNPAEFFKHLEEDLDSMIEARAKDMVLDKYHDTMMNLDKIKNAITEHTDSMLRDVGIPPYDDGKDN